MDASFIMCIVNLRLSLHGLHIAPIYSIGYLCTWMWPLQLPKVSMRPPTYKQYVQKLNDYETSNREANIPQI